MNKTVEQLAQFLKSCPGTAPLAELVEAIDLKSPADETFVNLFVEATVLLEAKQKELDDFTAGVGETAIGTWLDSVERHARMLRRLQERTPQQQFDLDIYDEVYVHGIRPIDFDANDNFVWDEGDVAPFSAG